MIQRNSKKSPASDTYTIANIVLAFIIIILVMGNALYSVKQTRSLAAAKQARLTAEEGVKGQLAQQDFLASNPEIIEVIDNALPNQNGIIALIEAVEVLESSMDFTKSFVFTSPVPLVENNQHYLPFTMRINTTGLKAFDFLRRFEKLPYLTKITSLNIKTPAGLGGSFEMMVTGKVYVQDAFKN